MIGHISQAVPQFAERVSSAVWVSCLLVNGVDRYRQRSQGMSYITIVYFEPVKQRILKREKVIVIREYFVLLVPTRYCLQ